MKLFLFIAAIISLVVFFISYFRIVISAFRHHTVTGLISIFPGINLTVLPTVWGKMSSSFMLSIVSLGVSVGAWYAGGNQHLMINSSIHANKVSSTQSVNSDNKTGIDTSLLHKMKKVALPQEPLYYIVFKQVEVNNLGSLINEHIRVKLVDDRELEGKNIKTSDNSLFLETYNSGNIQLVKIASKHIKTLEKLVSLN